MSERKHRQCPHCKSKRGFTIQYSIVGIGREIRTFEGEVLNAYRQEKDTLDKRAQCLDCGEWIDTDKLDAD